MEHHFEIVPYEGAGQLKFGASRQDVENVLGPPESFYRTDYPEMMGLSPVYEADYDSSNINLAYDLDCKLNYICFSQHRALHPKRSRECRIAESSPRPMSVAGNGPLSPPIPASAPQSPALSAVSSTFSSSIFALCLCKQYAEVQRKSNPAIDRILFEGCLAVRLAKVYSTPKALHIVQPKVSLRSKRHLGLHIAEARTLKAFNKDNVMLQGGETVFWTCQPFVERL